VDYIVEIVLFRPYIVRGWCLTISYKFSQLILQARVGRIADGLDIDLYNRALEIRRQFEGKYLRDTSASSF
jgi:hypothetical protein